jgi:hypothetical protein
VPTILKTLDDRDAIVVDDAVPRELLPYLFDTFGQAEKRCRFQLPTVVVYSGCWHAKSARNFAGIRVGSPTELHLCADLAEQPPTRIRGILWHEVGHVIDEFAPKGWRRRTHIRGPDSEQWADIAVETYCRVKIFYDEDLVQRVGPGYSRSWTHPRPKGLR